MITSPTISVGKHEHRSAYLLLASGIILMGIASLIGISDNPPGIVSMLVGWFAIVLGIIYRFGKPGRRTPAQQLLYWSPRALCITFAAFVSLFALDAFSKERGIVENILAFLMHLIPTYILLLVLAVSWRREWVGGILYIALGSLYIATSWNKPFGTWSTLLIMSGPLFLTGALFLLNWHYRRELRGIST